MSTLTIVQGLYWNALRETERSPGRIDAGEALDIIEASPNPGWEVRDWLGRQVGEGNSGAFVDRPTQNLLRKHVGLWELPSIAPADANTIRGIFEKALLDKGAVDEATVRLIMDRAGRYPSQSIISYLKGKVDEDSDQGFFANTQAFNLLRLYLHLPPVHEDIPPASLPEIKALYTNALGDPDNSPGSIGYDEARKIIEAAGKNPLPEVLEWLRGKVNPSDEGFYENHSVFRMMADYVSSR
jgi:hypothetical protein